MVKGFKLEASKNISEFGITLSKLQLPSSYSYWKRPSPQIIPNSYVAIDWIAQSLSYKTSRDCGYHSPNFLRSYVPKV